MNEVQTQRDTLQGLKQLAARCLNQVKSIRGRAEGRELTPDEETQIDQLLDKSERAIAEAGVVQKEIQSAGDDERIGFFASMQTSSRPASHHNPIASGPYVMTGSRTAAPAGAPGIGGGSFASMFPQARVSASREFGDWGSFGKAVVQRDPRLFTNAASGMGESVGPDGGFYVPVGMYAGVMDDSLQQEAIRPNATIIPMTSAQVTIPMFDLSNRSTGIATMEGKVTGEGTTGTTQKAKVREVNLVARKISVLVPASMELLQDAPALFGGLLQKAMTDALAQTLDTWFISGTGAGAPLGILNCPCLVSVAKDGSQVAATLTPTNIAGMVSRLAPGSWAKSVWLVSPSALAALFTLKTVVTNVAGVENVGGFAPEFFSVLPDGKFALCGRPLVVSDRCSALGTKGDIMLVDLSQYMIGIRQDAELSVDTSIGFKESEVWFRLNCRVDGQPVQAAAITPRVGSATLSPFVTLDARG